MQPHTHISIGIPEYCLLVDYHLIGMHRDLLETLTVRENKHNYIRYIFHKPPLLGTCRLFTPETMLHSFQACLFFSADMWHSDLWFEAPNRTAGASKDVHLPSSCHPALLHNVTLAVVRPPTRYFITLLTLLSFQWHTYFYLHDAIASFFCPGMALKQEFGNEIGAQLILTSFWRWKCYLNTLDDAHCIDYSIRWVIVMLFLHGEWSACRAAVKHQLSENIMW